MSWIKQNSVRLIGLALAVLAVIALAVGLFGRGGGGQSGNPSQGPQLQTTLNGGEVADAADNVAAGEASSDTSTLVKTVAYYQDSAGHLVPVMREIPQQSGVARATLALMVKNSDNDRDAARMGLETVLPADCSIDLDIRGNGLARIDLGPQANATSSAAAEANMVQAVVQTLTEFPTVGEVEFLIDGKKLSTLKHGTDVSAPIKRSALNLESVDANASELAGSERVQLYFTDQTARLMIPVTRTVFGAADVNTAVLELAKGPGSADGLKSALPENCGLIGVTVNDGVATVNFTEDFINVAQQSDGGRAALKALALTCAQFKGVNEVKIQVEGEAFALGDSPVTAPAFANAAAQIETVAASTLNFE